MPEVMADSDGFPIDAQRAIEHCAALIMHSVDLAIPQGVESVRIAARLRFEAALAAPIRARNARDSAVFSVPNELWIATWSYLPAHDRLIASHVCHAWREVALSAPTLWTQIVPAYHLKLASGSNYWRCGECESDGVPETFSSPMAPISTLLDRSGGLPVCVRLSNYYDFPHLEYVRDICRLLELNQSRIEELHISIGSNPHLASKLLDALRTLPALRTLTVSMIEVDLRLCDPVFEVEHGFPVLESMSLSPGFTWGLPFKLPRLRTLSLAVYDASDLSMALRNFPALHSLRIIPRFKPYLLWDAALLMRLSTVPEVCIDGMEDTYALWFARVDGPAPGARMRLVHRFNVPSGTALSVLRAFAPPVHAECLVDAERYVLELSDVSRTLVLEWPLACGISSVWDFVGPASIEADPTAWQALLSRLPPARATGVRVLKLRLHSAEDILQMALDPGDRCQGFPELTELAVRGMQPDISLHVASITALREQLRLPARVNSLRISGVRVLGDAGELSRMADNVVYGAS